MIKEAYIRGFVNRMNSSGVDTQTALYMLEKYAKYDFSPLLQRVQRFVGENASPSVNRVTKKYVMRPLQKYTGELDDRVSNIAKRYAARAEKTLAEHPEYARLSNDRAALDFRYSKLQDLGNTINRRGQEIASLNDAMSYRRPRGHFGDYADDILLPSPWEMGAKNQKYDRWRNFYDSRMRRVLGDMRTNQNNVSRITGDVYTGLSNDALYKRILALAHSTRNQEALGALYPITKRVRTYGK